jgi:hypothetical protein
MKQQLWILSAAAVFSLMDGDACRAIERGAHC